ATFAALAVVLLLWAEDADARLEGAPSVGKSAGGTFLTPQVAAPALAVIAANDHAAAGSSSYPGGSLGGLFSRPGVLGGFAAGFSVRACSACCSVTAWSANSAAWRRFLAWSFSSR